MAPFPNIKVIFATLPREVRDKIFELMLTNSKTISTTECAAVMVVQNGLGFLNRPVYYVKGQVFQKMMFLVNRIEIKLVIHEQTGTRYGLPGCFRDLLACPVLCHVTFKVGLLRVGLYYDTDAEWSYMSEDRVLDKKNSDGLDEILTLTSGMYRQLKEKIGEELKFETNYLRVGEKIKAWEERIGKAAVEQT